MPLKMVDHVASLGVMVTLMGAGYGIAFGIASQVQALNRPDIATPPLFGWDAIMREWSELLHLVGQWSPSRVGGPPNPP